MSRRLSFIAVLLLAAAASATDSAPADSPQPTPKHKLGGGFKGQPVASSSPSQPLPAKTGAPAEKPAAASAQSRKTAPRIVINNDLVKKTAPSEGGKSGSAAGKASTVSAAPPAPVEMPKIVDLQGHDESYWKAKAAGTREAVAKAKDIVAAAEAEEKREENDFYSWDDGQYRDNVIKPAWDRAKEEAVKARESLDEAQKQLDQLEDDARKAGAYPGWIRE